MKKLIRNVLDVDVDGWKGVNHYTVKAMYDVIAEDGFATIEHELLARFDYKWSEIDEMGGTAVVNEMIAKKYNLEIA